MLKLYYNLFREKRAFGPDKQFKRSLQKKLQTAWGELYPSRLMWYQMPAFRYSMVALVVLIFVSTTGVGAYAYNSTEVTEGTRLYGIKRAIERVEEKVVERRAPEVQAKFYLKQIERREAERQVIEKVRSQEFGAKSLQKTEEKIERTEKQLERVNQALINASTTVKDTKVIEQVQKRLETRKERIENKIEIENKKLEKINPAKSVSSTDRGASNLNLNPQPYEKSNHGVSGDGGGVGNGDASASSSTAEESKANGKAIRRWIKQRVLNTGAGPSEIRPKAGVNSR